MVIIETNTIKLLCHMFNLQNNECNDRLYC